MFQSLSGRLPTGVRFLPYPVPASPWARLAARFPVREECGLTVLHPSNMSGLDPAFPSVAYRPRVAIQQGDNQATYLLVQACQQLWLVFDNEV